MIHAWLPCSCARVQAVSKFDQSWSGLSSRQIVGLWGSLGLASNAFVYLIVGDFQTLCFELEEGVFFHFSAALSASAPAVVRQLHIFVL